MEDKVRNVLFTLRLQRWSENLINNDVNYDTLKYMTINQCPELAEVIPSVGARIALQNYFRSNDDSCKEINAPSDNNLPLASTSTPFVTPSLTLALTPGEIFDESLDNTTSNNDIKASMENATQSSFVEESSVNDTQNIVILDTYGHDNEIVEELQRIDETVDMMLENFDLKALLKKTVTGQAIIASYDARSGLSLRCQQYLANIIICHFFDININVQLNNEKLNKIADHIITLFPAECKEVYYCPPIKKKQSKDQKSGIAKGKLVDKNRNMLAFLRKYKLIPLSKSVSVNSSTDEDSFNKENTNSREEAERSHNWLKNNFEPWEEVLLHWEKSFLYRNKLIHDRITYPHLCSIFNDWNILTSSMGYVLIEKDYLRLYKEKYKNVQEKFDSLFDDVLRLRGKELDCSNKLLLDMLSGNIPNDSKILLKIYLLFSLLPNKSSKVKVGKNFFKPTQVESQESLVLHIKIPGDVEEEIENKRKKLQNLD
ncbi:uncharacterized protein [Temnothorax longispinosus]|uniref:uncharacterized protein n=1 Tax=Temnothorax longispinosus TaxID=300112 RepID=UPI003A99FD15